MHLMSHAIPSLPGFAGPKTYASWPVWKGSVRQEVRFSPMAKRQAVQLWHKARKFDRATKLQGKHGGLIGHAGLHLDTMVMPVVSATVEVSSFDWTDLPEAAQSPRYGNLA